MCQLEQTEAHYGSPLSVPHQGWHGRDWGRGEGTEKGDLRSEVFLISQKKKKKKRGVGAVRDERGKGGTKAARKSKMPYSLQRKHEYFTDSVNNIEPRRNKFLIVPSSLSHISDTYLK